MSKMNYRKEELEKRLLPPADLPAYLSLSLDRKAFLRLGPRHIRMP
jgi:hypothetical protein